MEIKLLHKGINIIHDELPLIVKRTKNEHSFEKFLVKTRYRPNKKTPRHHAQKIFVQRDEEFYLRATTLFQKPKLLSLTQTPFGRHQLSYDYGGFRVPTNAETILFTNER